MDRTSALRGNLSPGFSLLHHPFILKRALAAEHTNSEQCIHTYTPTFITVMARLLAVITEKKKLLEIENCFTQVSALKVNTFCILFQQGALFLLVAMLKRKVSSWKNDYIFLALTEQNRSESTTLFKLSS